VVLGLHEARIQQAGQRSRSFDRARRPERSVVLVTGELGQQVPAMSQPQDRARKVQSDPSKLRKHVESFYSDLMNRSNLADRLRPAIRMWLTFTESDADVDKVCLSLAQSHFEQSRFQLLNLAEEHKDEEFVPQALTTLLGRWESTRAADAIDRLIKDGMTTVTTSTIVKTPRPLSVETVAMHTKQWKVENDVEWAKSGMKPPPPNLSPALLKRRRQIADAVEQ
jgi:hypothetical protein